jgi:hypothetical protein
MFTTKKTEAAVGCTQRIEYVGTCFSIVMITKGASRDNNNG